MYFDVFPPKISMFFSMNLKYSSKFINKICEFWLPKINCVWPIPFSNELNSFSVKFKLNSGKFKILKIYMNFKLSEKFEFIIVKILSIIKFWFWFK